VREPSITMLEQNESPESAERARWSRRHVLAATAGSAAVAWSALRGGTRAEAAAKVDNAFASRVINVKDYGAKGDGSNDTSALQRALDASREGDAIYFPPGIYLTDASLFPKARQTYFSLGNGATIKADNGRLGLFIVRTGSVAFHNLTLDLSKPTATEPPDCGMSSHAGISLGVGAGGIVDLVVTCCRIRHSYAQGILIDGGRSGRDRVIVRDLLVEDCCESGLTLTNVNGARVEASQFTGCRNGVQVAFSRDIVISSVNASENRRHGIAVLLSHNWHVTDCVARLNGSGEKDRAKRRGWGIAAGGGPQQQGQTPNSRFTISNNTCEDNYAGGITLDPTVDDDPTTPRDESKIIWSQEARVSGNVCQGRDHEKPVQDATPIGVQVRNSREVVVIDNICHHNGSGIALVNAVHVLVESNTCYSNKNAFAIYKRPGLPDPMIKTNTLCDNDAEIKRGQAS
jgi:parallel beta-helix repeat protein